MKNCNYNRHLYLHLELILDCPQKCKPPGQTTKKEFVRSQKELCAPGTQARIVDLDNRFFEMLKCLFVLAKFAQTLFIWTKHDPKKVSNAIVIPTIRGGCTRRRYCSELFHTCLQRNIGSCRNGGFRDCYG